MVLIPRIQPSCDVPSHINAYDRVLTTTDLDNENYKAMLAVSETNRQAALLRRERSNMAKHDSRLVTRNRESAILLRELKHMNRNDQNVPVYEPMFL